MMVTPIMGLTAAVGFPPNTRFLDDLIDFGKVPPANLIRFGGRTSQKPDPPLVPLELQVSPVFKDNLIQAAHRVGMEVGAFLQKVLLPEFSEALPAKEVCKSRSVTVQGSHQGKPVNTKVTSLIGPEQIFQGWIKALNQTQHYAQIALFDFDNAKVGGRRTDGAAATRAWSLHQQILPLIEQKAKAGVRFQIILDGHREAEYDDFGYRLFPVKANNEEMYQYLLKLKEKDHLPIDVVVYPRAMANIYHLKLLISDGLRAIVGGMNLSNHSAANWDACLLLEASKTGKANEIANLQQSTFHQDWIFSKYQLSQKKRHPAEIVREELPTITPVDHPAIRVLNTMPAEYREVGFEPREEILAYLDEKLSSPKLSGLMGEQFILTHIPTKEKLLTLQQKGIPIRLLHANGVLEKFPYCRKTVFDLMQAGLHIRFYKEWEKTGEQLHAKWLVLENADGQDEVLIGSDNLSAAALESNTGVGKRENYPPDKQKRFTRGNRDIAIAIQSKALADVFKEQFKKDWDYSTPFIPPAYGLQDKADKLLPHPASATEQSTFVEFLTRYQQKRK